MKKNILAIAIATAVAAPVAMADAKIYGQLNLAADSASERGTNIEHRNSRLGVKGSEDLGNGLKAIYQMEGTVNYSNLGGKTDVQKVNDTTGFAMNRNTFVGLNGGFGTVVMGRHDTPLRMIQPSDGFADSKLAGNNTSNFNGLKTSGEDRLSNVLAYMSPDFNGIKFAVAAATINSGSDSSKGSSLENAISANVTYGSKKSGLFVAGGLTQVAESSTNAKNDRQNVRVTVQYNEAGLLGYVMFNQLDGGKNFNQLDADENKLDNGNSITLGGAYKLGAITPRAKIAMITYDKKKAAFGETKKEDSSMSAAVGVDYALGKTTRVYAEYAMLDKNNRKYSVDDGKKAVDTSVFSVGLFHKF